MAERPRRESTNYFHIKGSPINTASTNPERNLSDIRAKNKKIRKGLGITMPRK